MLFVFKFFFRQVNVVKKNIKISLPYFFLYLRKSNFLFLSEKKIKLYHLNYYSDY